MARLPETTPNPSLHTNRIFKKAKMLDKLIIKSDNMNNIEQNQTILTESGLTPIQEQAATLLASGENISAVAEKLNLNRGTIYQWQQKLTFKCFFNLQRKEAKDTLKSGLFSLYNEALEAIKGCLKSENESIKLKTATYIIQKVEDSQIGGTDIRAVLKEKATKVESIFPDFETEREVFDEKVYKRLLLENSLKDDE